MKKIITMTTLPDRICHIQPCIESLINQENVDLIELNIPYISKRFNKTYEIPEWLKETDKLKIFRTEDYGPLTKIYPTLKRYNDEPDTIFIIVDDDCIYSKGYLKLLLDEYECRKNTIICGSGCVLKTRKVVIGNNEYCDIVQGFSGIIIPWFRLTKEIEKYFNFVLSNDDGFLSDDIIISNLLFSLHYKLFCLPLKTLNTNLTLLNFDTQLKHGNIKRYINFMLFLHANGYYWFKKEVPSLEITIFTKL